MPTIYLDPISSSVLKRIGLSKSMSFFVDYFVQVLSLYLFHYEEPKNAIFLALSLKVWA